MKHDYGDVARGLSYEYVNFYLSLQDLGHDVTLFDYMAEIKHLGRAAMNQKLLQLVQEAPPDLAMFSLYTDQFDAVTVKQLSAYTRTLSFFHDDTWRVEFSQFWAHQFDYFTTPDVYGEAKYAALGLPNAIHFPFGCNEKIYRKTANEKRYDISFVGGWDSYREWLVQRLRRAGLSVRTAGYRWPQGMLSHEQMVDLFNESRINLNMSNSTSWDARYLLASPRGLVKRLRSKKNIEQLKARHFEINGCGGFQLSFYVEGLERQYQIGNEIAIYVDPDDLISKARFYLANPELREAIADAGYQRTQNEHLFRHRFQSVFQRMGLDHA